jgi:hypothetical protein
MEASYARQNVYYKTDQFPKEKNKNASTGPHMYFHPFDASYVLTSKSGKVVAKYVGPRHKSLNTCVWVLKVLVSNVKGPEGGEDLEHEVGNL